MRIAIIIIHILIIAASSTAQVQRCGIPSYAPKNGEGNMYIDTCARLSYTYSGGGVWFCQNNLHSETQPQILLVSSNGIFSNYSKVSWYRPTTGYWYDVVNGAWRSRVSQFVDSLLNSNNTWLGRNIFKDTITAEKGIRSLGMIDTKGMKSSGSSLKAASENNGVQKDAVIELTNNILLDGTYNTIVGNAATADIVLTLPTLAVENNGWKYVISKKATSAFNVRVTASGFNHVIISPDAPILIRNKGGTWVAE